MTQINFVSKNGRAAVERWIQMVRAEFREAPGLQLTRGQLRRLCGLDDQTCATVLDVLMQTHFLHLKPDGRYARTGHGLSLRRGVAR
jgi:hypothetical protein